MATNSNHKLWVVESSGTPRSGKGTISAGLAETIPGATHDETGADYRTVTLGLLNDKIINPKMDDQQIIKTIEDMDYDSIVHYAAQRYELISEFGNEALYSLDVAKLVGKISPIPSIRQAVKDGFKKRLKVHAENPNIQILFVDGRNLAPVIEQISEINILLRLFVDCQPFIAAKREALRQNIDTTDSLNDKWYRDTVQNIQERQKADEYRKLDPVCKDSNSINYWYNAAIEYETSENLAKQRCITFAAAADMIASGSGGHFRQGGRHGAGAKATAENRQVYFDTTEINKPNMLSFVERMVEEALDYHSGQYKPAYPKLFNQ